MKKTLIAAAVLSGFAGAAMAQNVTIYGIVDASIVNLDNGTNDIWRLDSGRNAASRFGVRGSEDLGGGLKAVFLLENGFDISNGSNATGTDNPGFWNRLAYVGLEGGFGGLRMGRQDSPMRTALNVIDPFINAGMNGAIDYFGYTPTLGGSSTMERVSQSVTYILPSGIGGVNGSVAYRFGESAVSSKLNSAYAFNIGYGAGPVAVQAAYSRQNPDATDALNGAGVGSGGNIVDWIVGGTYDAGVVKVHVGYHKLDGENAAGAEIVDTQALLLGVTVPLGDALKLRASYIMNKVDEASDSDSQAILASLTYAMSKRTQLYFSVGLTDNDTNADMGVVRGGTAGEKAHGIAFGVQHNF